MQDGLALSVHNIGRGLMVPTEVFAPALDLIFESFDVMRHPAPKYNEIKLGQALALLMHGTFPNSTINAGMDWPGLYEGHGVNLPFVKYRIDGLLGQCLH